MAMALMTKRTLGLKQVYPNTKTENGDFQPADFQDGIPHLLNIIAIHGLDTTSDRTFCAYAKEGDKTSRLVHWLRDEDMLSSNFTSARIYTYDWNAAYIGEVQEQYFWHHAKDLLAKLVQETVALDKRPIIFVASCYGGLLLAKALCIASEAASHAYNATLDSTIGILFLGTPFRGSDGAPAAITKALVAGAMGYTSSTGLVNFLENKSGELAELRNKFSKLARNRWPDENQIVCFFETETTNLLNAVFPANSLTAKYLAPITNKLFVLVDYESACLDDREQIGLPVPHALLNKFRGPDDPNFKTVKWWIAAIAENAGVFRHSLADGKGKEREGAMSKDTNHTVEEKGLSSAQDSTTKGQGIQTGTAESKKKEEMVAKRVVEGSSTPLPSPAPVNEPGKKATKKETNRSIETSTGRESPNFSSNCGRSRIPNTTDGVTHYRPPSPPPPPVAASGNSFFASAGMALVGAGIYAMGSASEAWRRGNSSQSYKSDYPLKRKSEEDPPPPYQVGPTSDDEEPRDENKKSLLDLPKRPTPSKTLPVPALPETRESFGRPASSYRPEKPELPKRVSKLSEDTDEKSIEHDDNLSEHLEAPAWDHLPPQHGIHETIGHVSERLSEHDGYHSPTISRPEKIKRKGQKQKSVVSKLDDLNPTHENPSYTDDEDGSLGEGDFLEYPEVTHDESGGMDYYLYGPPGGQYPKSSDLYTVPENPDIAPIPDYTYGDAGRDVSTTGSVTADQDKTDKIFVSHGVNSEAFEEVYEGLDSKYQIRPSSCFLPGKVFKAMFRGPAGLTDSRWGVSLPGESVRIRSTAEEPVDIQTAYFIVVSTDEGHSTCIPLSTYNRKGCSEKGVKPQNHGIVYEAINGSPKRLKHEPQLGFRPVAIQLNVKGEKIAKETRANYSKLCTIEHNVKVSFVGNVVSRDWNIVSRAVDECWISRMKGPSRVSRYDRGRNTTGNQSVLKFPDVYNEGIEENLGITSSRGAIPTRCQQGHDGKTTWEYQAVEDSDVYSEDIDRNWGAISRRGGISNRSHRDHDRRRGGNDRHFEDNDNYEEKLDGVYGHPV